jgi:adenosylcobinamide kinase/adenosylcobinamide-phosphate guanylyltransferase
MEGGAMGLMLITGGVRSGKSRFAEQLAEEKGAPVLYAATGQAWDDEMRQRIRNHQERRPAHWGLAEIGTRLEDVFRFSEPYSVILLDCLSGWISNRLMLVPQEQMRDRETSRQLLSDAERWLKRAAGDSRTYVVVTDEVGLGGVALTPLGRWFADLLGEVNQLAAREADTVHAVFCGLPWRLKG